MVQACTQHRYTRSSGCLLRLAFDAVLISRQLSPSAGRGQPMPPARNQPAMAMVRGRCLRSIVADSSAFRHAPPRPLHPQRQALASFHQVRMIYVHRPWPCFMRIQLRTEPAVATNAGKRQAKVELPALWLSVTAQEVADEPALPDLLAAAADGGATAVVLRDGASARLYVHTLLSFSQSLRHAPCASDRVGPTACRILQCAPWHGSALNIVCTRLPSFERSD